MISSKVRRNTPKPRARAPKKIASKQTKTTEGNVGELGIKVLKEWFHWGMPLFKMMEAATVKEEWRVWFESCCGKSSEDTDT